MASAAQVLPFEAPKEKAAPTFGDLLAATKTTDKAKASKSKMPTLEGNAEVKEAIDTIIEATVNKKQAEAVIDANRPKVEDYVRAEMDASGYRGAFHGSFAVMGNRHTAKVIFQNKYTLTPEDKAELQNILGDNFSALIKTSYTVKLKAAVFENPELGEELARLLGDRAGDFLESVETLAVCEEFNKLIYQAVKPEDLADLRTFARQYKPTIR